MATAIVITHNNSSTIKVLIESLKRSNLKILVWDRGSSDNTVEILSSFDDIVLYVSSFTDFFTAVYRSLTRVKDNTVIILHGDTIIDYSVDDIINKSLYLPYDIIVPISQSGWGKQNMYLYNTFENIKISDFSSIKRLMSSYEDPVETKFINTFALIGKRHILLKLFYQLQGINVYYYKDLLLSLYAVRNNIKMAVLPYFYVIHLSNANYNIGVPLNNEMWNDIKIVDNYFMKEGFDLEKHQTKLFGREMVLYRRNRMDKRVAIFYDNRKRPDTTGNYCYWSLMSICENVKRFNPEDVYNISPDDYDLFVSIDDGLPHGWNENLHPSSWWVIDTHLQWGWDIKRSKVFDYVFVAQYDAFLKMREMGMNNVFYLPLAAYPPIHQGYDNLPVNYNVSFVGNVYKGKRSEYIDYLKENIENVFIGKGLFQAMTGIYSRSKIVFNIAIKNDVNMRVFEGAISGKPFVTDNLDNNGMSLLFGDEIFRYKNKDEMVSIIKKILKKYDYYREKAYKAMIKTVEEHSYVNRMERIVEKGLVFQKTKDNMPVSIIMLYYNTPEITNKVVSDIVKYSGDNWELVLIDQGSREKLNLPKDSRIKYIRLDENVGFAKGNNIGMDNASYETLLFLNSDVYVYPGYLNHLKNHLKEGVGAVGPLSDRVKGFQMVQYVYDEKRYFEDATLLHIQNYGKSVETHFLSGFALLTTKSVMRSCGGWSEDYSIGNYEDDDLSYVMKKKGYKLVIALDVILHHHAMASFKKNRIDYEKRLLEGKKTFIKRWGIDPDFIYLLGNISFLLKDKRYEEAKEIIDTVKKEGKIDDKYIDILYLKYALMKGDTNMAREYSQHLVKSDVPIEYRELSRKILSLTGR